MSHEERLLVITLALEEACRNEAWEELSQLLSARDACIADLERCDLLSVDSNCLERVRSVQERVRAELSRRQAEVVREFREDAASHRARDAYRRPAERHSLDSDF
jgi:hypothetical protein